MGGVVGLYFGTSLSFTVSPFYSECMARYGHTRGRVSVYPALLTRGGAPPGSRDSATRPLLAALGTAGEDGDHSSVQAGPSISAQTNRPPWRLSEGSRVPLPSLLPAAPFSFSHFCLASSLPTRLSSACLLFSMHTTKFRPTQTGVSVNGKSRRRQATHAPRDVYFAPGQTEVGASRHRVNRGR